MVKFHTLKSIKQLFFIFVVVFGISESTAQETKDNDSTFDKSSKTFLAIPIINNTPVTKTGFGALGMYFFKTKKDDQLSPPSLVSLYALYTTNKSYFFIPFAKLFWNEDKNRATIGTGFLRVNGEYNYEEEDVRLVYSEYRKFLMLEYSRKIVGDFYLGLLYLGTKTDYRFDLGTDEENEFTEEFFKENGIEDNFVSSIGLNISFDNRDYPYYPTKGFSLSARPKVNAGWLGSENDYVDIDYKFAYYHSFKEKKILAMSIAGGFAFGDVPFDGYQSYGVKNNLRGYEAGKYKGKHMIAAQAEYRYRFYKKWGAVFFAGTGSIWSDNESEDDDELFEKNWLPSAGAGLRFMISKEKKINLRLDYAVGIGGNQGLYFGVMEAF